MRFVKVDKVPGDRVRKRGEMRDLMEEFMKMNAKSVRIDDHGYKTSKLAYMAFRRAVERWVFPIDVRLRNDEVYLVRRDM